MDRGAWWGCGLWGCKESDTTKQLTHTHTHTWNRNRSMDIQTDRRLPKVRELRQGLSWSLLLADVSSCLENPRDGGAWWAAVYGVAQSWTWLKWLSSSSSSSKLLYREWINNKVLPYSTKNYIHYPMINHNGKEYKKEGMCVYIYIYIVVFCSVAKLCPTLCHPMDCSMPSFPILHYLLEFAQIYVHWVWNAI